MIGELGRLGAVLALMLALLEVIVSCFWSKSSYISHKLSMFTHLSQHRKLNAQGREALHTLVKLPITGPGVTREYGHWERQAGVKMGIDRKSLNSIIG